ncbi:hypothetical protein MRX96_027801 [Rhipicephalus microplus]
MTEHQHSSLDLVVMLCVCTILASAVATSRGGDLPCEPAEGRECLRELLPLHHCNASLQEDGRVRVLCKILIKAAPQLYFIPSDPEVMTMDERLVSDAPPKDGKLAALSLTRVDIKKWDDFPLTLQSNYDVFRVNASTLLEQLALYSFMCFVRQVEFSVTFEKPLKIAVANCSKTQGGRPTSLRCLRFQRGASQIKSRQSGEEALLGLMRLEILNLSHNRIGTVSGAAIFRHLTSLVSLDVSFNEVKNLEHLSTRAGVAVRDSAPTRWSAKNRRDTSVCAQSTSNGTLASAVRWTFTRQCGFPLLFTALAATVISYGLYTKRWYMMYALLYLRVKIKNYKRQLHCGRFMWDAFLCYHVSDATWTTEVLLARLESPPMRYRVCVAERDFIPGIPITENICRCISQSRVSLFVLSSEFCRSRWCMFEMMLAQHRLFESDRDEHIVLIRKGPIDESQMCPTLSYLTSSRTYIGAPESESDERLQDLFWLQLQMALQQ